MASKAKFAQAAETYALLIAEYRGDVQGIGTREELEALVADKVLPEGTIIRQPVAGDF